MRTQKGEKNMKKGMKIAGITVLVLLLGLGVYGFTVYRSLSNMMNEVHYEVDTDDLRDGDFALGQTDEDGNIKPFSVLLLGIDADGPNDQGRSDSMMLVTVNPNEGSTNILSIQRDTRVEIVGRGFYDKINHAYAFGGAQMSINTVQNWLDVPVDYFVEIREDGFEIMIDAMGGVTVDNTTLAFSMDGYHFPLGTQSLDGSQALAFTRMRKQDPQGDFGRMTRQRITLEAMARRGLQVGATRFGPIMDAVGENMRTDFTLGDLVTLATNYTAALNQVEMMDLRGQGTTINGIWYLLVSDQERQEMTHLLRSHLELD